MFKFEHSVQFYETDMMGIVHHTNYLRFCEEARVAWAHHRGLIDYQKPESASRFAVVETWVKHLGALKFGDLAEIEVQAKLDGVRVVFEYKLRCPVRDSSLFCVARTSHVALDDGLKIKRPSKEMRAVMEKEKWNETWLLNL